MSQHGAPDWSVLNARLGAELMPWGPPLDDGRVIEVAESFVLPGGGVSGSEGRGFEAEYGAVRQRVGVMRLPQRAILELTGADVKDYLHRLCTQEINQLEGGATVRAFQLDEKGRIAADLIVHHGDPGKGGSTWLEMDVFDLPWVRDLVEARLFTEDVTVEDRTGQRELLWLLGPAAVRLLDAVVADGEGGRVAQMGATPGTHHVVGLPMGTDGLTRCTAYRWDLGGVLGVRLVVPSGHVVEVYERLLTASGYEIGAEADAAYAERRRGSMRGRPVGWSAFNTVRVEEGVPWYHVDFGRDSLPAEVPGPWGIDGAVSFTKGCYLGQEVVARMKSLGHPKRLLVGLRVDSVETRGVEMPGVPHAGAEVFEAGGAKKVIGGITSSTASPLRGQAGIALAVVRWGRHQPGTAVSLPAEGRVVGATEVETDKLVGG
ncbi:MAG: glycine cleavage T C-terminal barrel domain-containing protein [Planctomycetota bacterium]